MPSLLYTWLCCCFGLLWTSTSYAQDSPCHCLRFGLEFYDGAMDLHFVADSTLITKKGEKKRLYREQNYGHLMALVSLTTSPKKSCPTVSYSTMNAEGSSDIVVYAEWAYDFEKAEQRLQAFSKNNRQAVRPLNRFDFLPPMNNTIEVHVQLFPVYKAQFPLTEEAITMEVALLIPAHPFYSDWNPASPFHQRLPSLRSKLAYLEGYNWTVKVQNGTTVTQQLTPRSNKK